MPSFNHGKPFSQDGPGYYDPAVTPTTNGAIPEAFRCREDVYRSLNPTHPFAACGKDARAYVCEHHLTLTMGERSPLGMLWNNGGSVLLIGVGYQANTFHHVVETVTGAPCLGRRTEAYPVRLRDGRMVEGRTWGWREAPCPFTDRNRYAEIMADEGREAVTEVGTSRLTCFSAEDCYEVVSRLLAFGRDGFPPCSRCPVRPRKTARTVPSDWDERLGRPVADSPSFRYSYEYEDM